MTGDLIRVLLADDHAVVRAGLKAVLGTAKDITGGRRGAQRSRSR